MLPRPGYYHRAQQARDARRLSRRMDRRAVAASDTRYPHELAMFLRLCTVVAALTALAACIAWLPR